MTETAHPSLYSRLGGYDAIVTATDELLNRLMKDPLLGNYWKGASHDNQRRARQLIVDFMVESAGGPAYYTGRSMQISHAGMGIDAADWETFMRHASDTLDYLGVGSEETNEVLSFLSGLKQEIVDPDALPMS